MKYKVGDKVRIKSYDWYNSNKNEEGNIDRFPIFVPAMSRFCGMVATVTKACRNEVKINLDDELFYYGEYCLEDADLTIDENTAILCKTRESAQEVLRIADNMGYRWCNGNSFIHDDNWSVFEEETCYNIARGNANSLTFLNYSSKIILAEDFIKEYKNTKRVAQAFKVLTNGVDINN